MYIITQIVHCLDVGSMFPTLIICSKTDCRSVLLQCIHNKFVTTVQRLQD